MSKENPVPKIRASLSMLFFALCIMVVCLQVSWRNAMKEVTHRSAPAGSGSGIDIVNRGIHTEDGRDAFLASPLPTCSEHGGDAYAGEHSDSDEELTVSFSSPRDPTGAVLVNNAPTQLNNSVQNTITTPPTLPLPRPEMTDSNNQKTKRSGEELRNSRGSGRGAALMRRYEGNNLRRSEGAAMSSHVAEASSREEECQAQRTEEGYGTLPTRTFVEETDL